MSPDVWAKSVAELVKGHISRTILPLEQRMSALNDEVMVLRRQLSEIPAGPAGPPGDRGDTGDPGPPGPAGADGVAGPIGATGAPGERGEKGDAGAEGTPGRDGRDGLPGVPGMLGEKGIDGRNGIDGKDGLDGLPFDAITFEQTAERRGVFVGVNGDRRKELGSVTLGGWFDRGVWKDTETYERGDGVTFGGNFWIAQKDAPGKPAEGDGWRLAVRKGRDGRDGERGAKGDQGPPGRTRRDNDP